MINRRYKKGILKALTLFLMTTMITGCSVSSLYNRKTDNGTIRIDEVTTENLNKKEEATTIIEEATTTEEEPEEATTEAPVIPEDHAISWNSDWKYADFSEIHSSEVMMYYSHADHRKNIVVAVNAGHGTEGGESVKTLCHPDGTPKVTGGTTSEGAVKSMSVSSGMTFNDGAEERNVTLSLARLVKKYLLNNGYDVLMIREEEDTQLDNIARTVFANNNADYHIALHYDGTESDKGAFYMSVPDNSTYRSMEPVASHWQEHNELGEALIEGMREQDVNIFSSGFMEMDLTQTSFSTIPSVDLEVGDAASDHSESTQSKLAKGIVKGLNILTVKNR